MTSPLIVGRVRGAIDHHLLVGKVNLVLGGLNLRMILDGQRFGLLERQHGWRLGEQCHRKSDDGREIKSLSVKPDLAKAGEHFFASFHRPKDMRLER